METPLPSTKTTPTPIFPHKTDNESEKGLQKSKQKGGKQDQDRSALVDITNDSPIVGLATGSSTATPKSSAVAEESKKALFISTAWTPRSGESILRDQVKTLLKKVEDDGKLPIQRETGLLIPSFVPPTPANTPSMDPLHLTPKQPEDLSKTQKVEDEEERSRISRSLMLEFSGRSEVCESPDCHSVISVEEERWSVQAEEDEDEEEEEEGIEQLCEGMERVSVRGAEFEGRHTRFVYDSEGEDITGEVLVREEERVEGSLVLRGLPIPTGKHLRFLDEDGEEVKDE